VDVSELAPGLWRWTARHPDWTPGNAGAWGPDVGCVYCEADGAILLIDPLVPSDGEERERFWRALDRDVERAGPPHVLLTCAWHLRSAVDVLDRYAGARLFVHERGVAELGAASERVTDAHRTGDGLPGGAVAIDAGVGAAEMQVLYWLPSHGALVAGDVLLGTDDGGVRVCPDDWLDARFDGEDVRDALRPLLDLPLERLLVSHGEPVLAGARDALAAALG